MDDEIPGIFKSDSFKVVPRNYVAYHNRYPCNQVTQVYVFDHNIIPGTFILKFKGNSGYIISKAKACYFVRGDVQKVFYI